MKVWSAIIVLCAGWSLWPYLWHGAFYHAIAVALLLLFWELKAKSLAGEIGFWLAVNNVVDEVVFDPQKIGVNEVVFAVLILIITIKRQYACPITKQNQR